LIKRQKCLIWKVQSSNAHRQDSYIRINSLFVYKVVQYNTVILKFKEKGEKTGWTYIEVPADVAQRLKKGNKKSFRVQGKLDQLAIKGVALLPMGEGSFIIPLNAALRKGIGKREGAMLKVQLAIDESPIVLNAELMTCLRDEPEALRFFNQLARSHQHYFSKWIESAKTDATKVKRIAQTVNAMVKGQSYGEMLRALKN
jgi:hypothetical protein